MLLPGHCRKPFNRILKAVENAGFNLNKQKGDKKNDEIGFDREFSSGLNSARLAWSIDEAAQQESAIPCVTLYVYLWADPDQNDHVALHYNLYGNQLWTFCWGDHPLLKANEDLFYDFLGDFSVTSEAHLTGPEIDQVIERLIKALQKSKD